MVQQLKNFEELVNNASSYLFSLSYSKLSVSRFTSIWKTVGRYMIQHGINYYNGSVGTRYLLNRSNNIDYKLLSAKEKRYIRAVSILSDFQDTGAIRKKREASTRALLKGKIGSYISDYIDHLIIESQLSQPTIKCSKRYLSVFLNYLNQHHLRTLSKLNSDILLGFINSLENYCVESRKSILQKVRKFLKYLYEKK